MRYLLGILLMLCSSISIVHSQTAQNSKFIYNKENNTVTISAAEYNELLTVKANMGFEIRRLNIELEKANNEIYKADSIMVVALKCINLQNEAIKFATKYIKKQNREIFWIRINNILNTTAIILNRNNNY